MPVITITGLVGSGAIEVGIEISRKLGIDYVDRMILAEAAKRMGTTVAAVAERTERPPTRGERIAAFARSVLERSALAGSGGDPYFGGGLDALLVREYRDFPTEGMGDVADAQLLEMTAAVMRELAASNRVIIAGRGANMILRDNPGALHVGLTSALDQRVQRIMNRENLDRAEAERFVAENDKGRNAYFQRFFKVHPDDPTHYHLMVNTDLLSTPKAAELVVGAARIVPAY
ncbi:MAG: cytidylate kinase-like family protein [Chloroflexota bacterium]